MTAAGDQPSVGDVPSDASCCSLLFFLVGPSIAALTHTGTVVCCPWRTASRKAARSSCGCGGCSSRCLMCEGSPFCSADSRPVSLRARCSPCQESWVGSKRPAWVHARGSTPAESSFDKGPLASALMGSVPARDHPPRDPTAVPSPNVPHLTARIGAPLPVPLLGPSPRELPLPRSGGLVLSDMEAPLRTCGYPPLAYPSRVFVGK